MTHWYNNDEAREDILSYPEQPGVLSGALNVHTHKTTLTQLHLGWLYFLSLETGCSDPSHSLRACSALSKLVSAPEMGGRKKRQSTVRDAGGLATLYCTPWLKNIATAAYQLKMGEKHSNWPDFWDKCFTQDNPGENRMCGHPCNAVYFPRFGGCGANKSMWVRSSIVQQKRLNAVTLVEKIITLKLCFGAGLEERTTSWKRWVLFLTLLLTWLMNLGIQLYLVGESMDAMDVV